MVELAIFDLDGTLNLSKQPIDWEMAGLLCRLLKTKKAAVISGGSFQQFDKSLLRRLKCEKPAFANLYLLPTNGASLYKWQDGWRAVYSGALTKEEKEKILAGFEQSLKATGFTMPKTIFGDIIEDRSAQITFSALGQNAPLLLKKRWDPDRVKRTAIVQRLKKNLPEFEIGIGGTTSIDVTRPGVNKGYGISKLLEYLNIDKDKAVFMGDALFEGGNDKTAEESGVKTIQVLDAEETKKEIRKII